MTDRRFIDELIRAVNEYRAVHQVEPLRHNAVISTISQSWSDRLARSGSMEHNPNRSYNGQPLGENIAMKWSSDRADYTGKEATDQWYSEVKKYDFSRHNGPGTGHFTQLVWKSSREIGVGRSQSRDGKWFVVANFFPAGNYVGRNAENVFPPRDAKSSAARGSRPTTVQEAARPPAATYISPSSSPWNRSGPDRTTVLTESPRTTPMMATMTVEPRQVRTGAVVERKQETKTKNGITTTTITETRREADGRIKTVTTETVESAGMRGAVAGERIGASGGVRELSLHFNAFDFNEPDSSKLHSSVTVSATRDKEKARNGSSPARSDRIQSTTVAKSSDREFANQVVRQHNVYRRQHGNVGDLTLNADLCKTAERWAQHLACIGRLQHSDTKHGKTGEPLGENIAYKFSSLKEGYTGEEVVNQWYSESKQFSYRSPDACADACGHFTQVIWKGSREIGVGRAFAEDGLRVFVVCNYYPAGNVIGRFKENVMPSK